MREGHSANKEAEAACCSHNEDEENDWREAPSCERITVHKPGEATPAQSSDPKQEIAREQDVMAALLGKYERPLEPPANWMPPSAR